MVDKIQKIGVLTGGGDAPGLNAVIRAVVKTALNEYGWEVLGIEDGFEGFIQPGKVRPMEMASVRGILSRGGTILGTTNRADPFNYIIEAEDGEQAIDISDRVVETARILDLDAVVVIGGDGSMRITQELIEKGFPAVGVPKTIDNDILITQVTFGFDTAINTAVEALDKLHTTAESHHRVIIMEVMGRDAGWIAMEAGIAGDADVILVPEIPYDPDCVAEKIRQRYTGGANYSIVVAAEGAQQEGGERVYEQKDRPGGMPRLGGIGEQVAREIRERTESAVRTMVLGYLQRGGSPSAFDRLLATRFGVMAVHLIAEGKLGHMVALQGDDIVSVPIKEAVSRQKLIPLESDLIDTGLALGVCLGAWRETIEELRQGSAGV
jgi:6-phosphofructokinase 1